MEAAAADLTHATVVLAGLEMCVKQVWDNFNPTDKLQMPHIAMHSMGKPYGKPP